MIIFTVLDWLLFIVMAVNVIYLFVFSIASCFRYKNIRRKSEKEMRFAMLIPAYKEDGVIRDTVAAALAQNYSKDNYDVVVISDQMKPETNEYLRSLPIHLVEVHFERSTKAKSLNEAMNQIGDDYDLAVILDADNIILPDFLKDVNEAFVGDNVDVVQAHRTAKNLNTPMALLDAVSEEINNSIFRLGHVNLGFSSALIGSGMAFRYQLLKQTMSQIDSVGEDREMELRLLSQGKHFYYLKDTMVLDEKIQDTRNFSNQRRRWLAAQWHYARMNVGNMIHAIFIGRLDYADKMFQHLLFPRVLCLGFVGILCLVITVISLNASLKWWGLLSFLTMALLIAIPRRLYTHELFMAILTLPKAFVLMALNLFLLSGASQTFIHTEHKA